MEVLKISKGIDRAMLAKMGEFTLVTNSNENTQMLCISKHCFFCSFFPLPQEFILSEDYNKMTLVKTYQGKNLDPC